MLVHKLCVKKIQALLKLNPKKKVTSDERHLTSLIGTGFIP